MMNRTLRGAALGLAAALAFASTSSAQVLASDDFTYPDGSLVGNGGWASHSGLPGTLFVSGGEVVVSTFESEDANLAFTPVAGNVYYAIDFRIEDPFTGPFTGTDNEYFAHFKDSGFNFAARLDVVAATGAGDYSVGIASDEATADTVWPTDLTFDTTYRATVRYDQDANIAELWIDAASEADPSILGEDRPDPGDSVEQFALRQSASDHDEFILVDNLIVGQTFDDVNPTSGCDTPASEPGPFACPGNVNILTSSGPPVQGTTVTYSMDTAASGVPGVVDTFLFVSLRNPDSCFNCPDCPTRFGELLIDFTPFAIANGSFSDAGPDVGGVTTHSIAVPTDANLCGQGISLQGVVLGTGSMGSGVALTNVWDVFLGSSAAK